MKELTITISGEANTGKSTMLLWLEQYLKKKGFNVELSLSETELYDYGSELRFRNVVSTDFDEKINVIKTDRKIILKSMQMKRDSTKKSSKGKTDKNN
jgi:hypothetical protein